MKCKFVAALLCTPFFLQSIYAENPIPYNQHAGFYISANTLPPAIGSLYTGYLFSNNTGIEAGVDAAWGFNFLTTGNAEIYHLDLKKIFPIGSRGEFFGKIGVGYIQSTEDTDLFGNDTSETTGTLGLTFGAGFGYDFTPAWVATAEVNAIAHRQTSTLDRNISFAPTIGITHYFNA